MNLEELQSVQSRERQSSSLQHLRASFYEEAGEYIGKLRSKRTERAAESDNPFDDPEIERLSDEIGTAEQTVESIYERRVGKVVKLASIAAAGMPCDDEGLTTEEERLFETLVDRIERNREYVLSVLDGESPDLDCTPAPADGAGTTTDTDPAAGTDDPSGTSDGARAGEATPTGSRPTPPDRPPNEGVEPTGTGGADEPDGPAADEPLDLGSAMGGSADAGGDPDGRSDPAPTGEPSGEVIGADPDGDEPDGDGDEPVERTTVRVTADVGDIYGIDGRSYDLSAEDVVTLPTPNAESLVSKQAAERLD
jgi:DNA replication factor GINS